MYKTIYACLLLVIHSRVDTTMTSFDNDDDGILSNTHPVSFIGSYEYGDNIFMKKLDYESSDSSDFPRSLEHYFNCKKENSDWLE